MEREIKFRARNAKVPRCWIYGYSFVEYGKHCIINDGGKFPVIAGSECQYTGQNDKNGKEIYRKDRLKENLPGNLFSIKTVEWIEEYCCFGLVPSSPYAYEQLSKERAEKLEVIGWDNTE